MTTMRFIDTISDLEALYGAPSEASLVKVADRITPQYRELLAASPFVALATCGPEGLDCSPRGEAASVVTVEDEKTVLMADRPGNNRMDSLRNIVRDPRIALLCLIPGSGTTLRINGSARLTDDTALRERMAVGGKIPRMAIVISVEEIYFQCARAIKRADLWNPEKHADPATLPSPGALLEAMSHRAIDGDNYDREWPERAASSMW